jgi:hypothetical protein
MSKKKCQTIKSNGEACQAAAGENGFCFMHDATRGAEKAAARRKGGFQRLAPSVADKSLVPEKVRSIESVLSVLDYALQETLALSNGIQRGRLLVSIAHGYIEALKTGELEQRLEAIEHALKLRKVEKLQKKAS